MMACPCGYHTFCINGTGCPSLVAQNRRYANKEFDTEPKSRSKTMMRNRDVSRIHTILTVVGLVCLALVAACVMANPSTKSQEPEAPCVSDWTQCANNMDVANHYKEMSHLRFECKWETNKKVKYGEAKWPWGYAFGSLFIGDSAPRTGIITLIEPDVQMQNKYGAMVHTEVECTYDLKQKKVTSVWWIGEKK